MTPSRTSRSACARSRPSVGPRPARVSSMERARELKRRAHGNIAQSFSREKHPIYLATIHTSKGVALRGDEWRNEGDTKVRKGINRHATTTIIPMTRRRRQHASIMPPLSQEHGHPTRGHCKPIAAHAQVAHDKQDRQLHKCAFLSGLTIRIGTLRSHQ